LQQSLPPVRASPSLPVSQALALFVKVIRKITKHLVDIQKASIGADIPLALLTSTSRVGDGGEPTQWKPVETHVEDELNEAGDEATKALREKQREMIDSLDLSK
jgi:N-acetyltransferase 10